jgi:hypothetical protein
MIGKRVEKISLVSESYIFLKLIFALIMETIDKNNSLDLNNSDCNQQNINQLINNKIVFNEKELIDLQIINEFIFDELSHDFELKTNQNNTNLLNNKGFEKIKYYFNYYLIYYLFYQIINEFFCYQFF